MNVRDTVIAGFTGIALAAASASAFAGHDISPPAAQPQGLYSADQLMGADVYSQGKPKQQVGEIHDILFGNDMHIQSFVVETDSTFGLGGKSYVVSPDQIRVQTQPGEEATEPQYRVTIDADKQQLSHYPLYSNSWWDKAQNEASEAWQQTKHTASSAWTSIESTTSHMVNGTQDAAGNTGDAAANAAHNAANGTKKAYQDATH